MMSIYNVSHTSMYVLYESTLRLFLVHKDYHQRDIHSNDKTYRTHYMLLCLILCAYISNNILDKHTSDLWGEAACLKFLHFKMYL